MATIAWTDDLTIDGSQIDFQHRQLIDAIADLQDALASGDRPRVAAAAPFLRLYAQVHFSDEERVLELIAWPGRAEHRRQHDGFRSRLDEFEGAVARGELAAGAGLLGFLAAWLQAHIRGSDRQFAAEVRALRQRR